MATFMGPLGAMLIAIRLGERRLACASNGEILETSSAEGRTLINLGLPFLLAAIALVANVRVEKLMLGTLSSTISVEIYQIAWLAFIAGYAPILSIRAVMLSWFGEVREDAEKMWYMIDEDGETQGPYRGSHMDFWREGDSPFITTETYVCEQYLDNWEEAANIENFEKGTRK